MTVVNINEEILGWYNTPEEGEDKETNFTSYVWSEFYDAMTTKAEGERGVKTAKLESGPAYLLVDDGGEGEGDHRTVVFSVGEQFFQVDGSYSSWGGTEWYDPSPEEVKAEEVLVTKYVSL